MKRRKKHQLYVALVTLELAVLADVIITTLLLGSGSSYGVALPGDRKRCQMSGGCESSGL